MILALLLGCSGEPPSTEEDCPGASGAGAEDCDDDGDGQSELDGDCDDTDPAVFPGAGEDSTTSVDDDCDGLLTDVWPLSQAETWPGEEPGQNMGMSMALLAPGTHGEGRLLVGATAAADPGDPGDGQGAAFLFEVGTDPLGAPTASFRDRRGQFAGAGHAVALPDLDDDGSLEVLVSAPTMDLQEPDVPVAGQVYLFEDPTPGVHWLDEADVILSGTEWLDFGTSVVVADWNGDGIEDLMVGATNIQQTYDTSGRAYLFEGPVSEDRVPADADATFEGEHAMDYFGQVLEGGFDADGDGTADLLAGALKGGGDLQGRAWLFLGPIAGAHTVDAAAAVIGGEDGAEVSYSLTAGDLDGDGRAELGVGAALDGGAGERAGAAGIFYGPTEGALALTDADLLVRAEQPNSFAGAAISLDGDIDGDGRIDLVLGVPMDRYVPNGLPGGAYIWTEPRTGVVDTTSADLALLGEIEEGAGRSLTVGDIDGDTLADLAIGAPRASEDAGRVYLVRGSTLDAR